MSATDQYVHCIIVDDEPLAQDVIAAHIARMPQLQVVQRCSNAMEAFEALHKNRTDLLFLDINMPVISGLNFLRSLKDPPAVILTTAYTDYALEGYELDVVDYLLKPIPFERFAKAVNKALQKLGQQDRGLSAIIETPLPVQAPASAPATAPAQPEKNYFFIKADGKLVKLNYDEIRYVEGMKDYLKIYTTGSTYVVHQTMKGMEEQLPATKFVRIHKSYIIAVSAIKSIAGNIIHIEKGELPLGNSYKDALLGIVSNSEEA